MCIGYTIFHNVNHLEKICGLSTLSDVAYVPPAVGVGSPLLDVSYDHEYVAQHLS